jgi:dipeptidyl-peptidase-4
VRRQIQIVIGLIFLAIVPLGRAQEKLLTIDDIFDPVKKVNFSGSVPSIHWLKDGRHYLLSNESSRRDVPRLQKVDAMTGEAVSFFDTAKMQAAFRLLGGITESDAKELASRGFYQLSNNEDAVLINWHNDLFYYQLGSDKAVRVTNNPEEEVGETFSPDDRMLGFVRGLRTILRKKSAKRLVLTIACLALFAITTCTSTTSAPSESEG